MAFNRERANGRSGKRQLDSEPDWFLWNPCVGIPGVCPPLAQWHQMTDGTYTLADVQMMNSVLDELMKARKQAMAT